MVMPLFLVFYFARDISIGACSHCPIAFHLSLHVILLLMSADRTIWVMGRECTVGFSNHLGWSSYLTYATQVLWQFVE